MADKITDIRRKEKPSFSSLIEKKRDGGEFSAEEIRQIVDSIMDAEMPEAQQAALAMAIYFKQMSAQETALLAEELRLSGEVIDLDRLTQPKIAKVSTGGDPDRPEFRWPAKGRIIQGFSNGGDGINIAVPEGTQVKAVEEGEVAFAGSELKGYGNMILIRHPNGYVSAYAHNSELEVKRGDKVKRGQTIAKSGQSGEVGSPQLHFEIRKGSSPVDPLKFLNGA